MQADKDLGTFSEVRARLDEIVVQVRDKELSLEKSLELYEEAIKLGNRCAELVDKPDYTAEEVQAAQELLSEQAPQVALSGEQIEDEPEQDAPSDDAPSPGASDADALAAASVASGGVA